jgi:hypothetical protein
MTWQDNIFVKKTQRFGLGIFHNSPAFGKRRPTDILVKLERFNGSTVG